MKILVTLDGSKFAESIIEPVNSLVEVSGAEVHLIEVVKPSGSVGWAQTPSSEPHALSGSMGVSGFSSEGALGRRANTREQAEERTRQVAEDYLKSVAAQYFSRDAVESVILGEDPAESISEYARSEKVDLIAIATHGRTGLARMMIGSVAGKLLQAGVAPLYLLRPTDLHSD